jgi:hypothetical protein
VADVIILTENASKVAMGEEDRTRTVVSHQRRFLAEMGKSTGDHEF